MSSLTRQPAGIPEGLPKGGTPPKAHDLLTHVRPFHSQTHQPWKATDRVVKPRSVTRRRRWRPEHGRSPLLDAVMHTGALPWLP